MNMYDDEPDLDPSLSEKRSDDLDELDHFEAAAYDAMW
jgi:hypothetical protein